MRIKYGESQPLALNGISDIMNILRGKRRRLEPTLLHFGGAKTNEKACMARAVASELAQGIKSEEKDCNQVMALSMMKEGAMEWMCRSPCSERVVVIDGIWDETLLSLEKLLVRIFDRTKSPCSKQGVDLVNWVFVIITDMEADEMSCKDESSRSLQSQEVVKLVKRKLLDTDALSSLYKTNTKSVIWQKGFRSFLPFVCSQGEKEDCASFSPPLLKQKSKLLTLTESPPALSDDRHDAMEKRRKILAKCLRGWKERKESSTRNSFSLQTLSRTFIGQDLAIRRSTNRLRNRSLLP